MLASVVAKIVTTDPITDPQKGEYLAVGTRSTFDRSAPRGLRVERTVFSRCSGFEVWGKQGYHQERKSGSHVAGDLHAQHPRFQHECANSALPSAYSTSKENAK